MRRVLWSGYFASTSGPVSLFTGLGDLSPLNPDLEARLPASVVTFH
jgi:hypothetical protein